RTVTDLRVTSELVPRLLQGDHDGTAGGISAKQRALRSVQYLYLLHAEQRKVVGVLTSDVDIVNVGAHLRLEGGERLGLSQTADVVDVGGGLPDIVGREEVGNQASEIERTVHLLRFQIPGRQGGDGNGDVLQVFAAALCRDHDLRQPVATFRLTGVRPRLAGGGARLGTCRRGCG